MTQVAVMESDDCSYSCSLNVESIDDADDHIAAECSNIYDLILFQIMLIQFPRTEFC